jgi:hypothetical protein
MFVAIDPKIGRSAIDPSKPQPGGLDRVEHTADIGVSPVVDFDEGAK